MKPLEDITVAVIDAGTFPCIAQSFAPLVKKVYYHSPFESEYLDVKRCFIGDGLRDEEDAPVERLDDFLDPDLVQEIDLFVFPDRGFVGPQKLLRSLGKLVWGSFGASEIELYRTRFYKLLAELGLPVIHYVVIRGVDKLAEHLQSVTNKHVKVNRFRENMETWHHIDYEHSRDYLAHLAVEFGGVADVIVFVVQDDIPTEIEIGYDGWNVRGEYPALAFQGYEKKNELYIGTLKKYSQLPEEVQRVNEAMSQFLRLHGYCNFFATEIRVCDGVPFFIDPTPRMPGQTGEQLLETCTNLPQVIYEGAQGNLIEPKFNCTCAMEATLHYTAGTKDEWKVLNLPEGMEQWVKLYQFCKLEGLYKFPPSRNDEVGVVLGTGDSPKAALEHLKENLEKLQDEPVRAELSGFVELAEQIEAAEKIGMEFSKEPLPGAAEVLEGT